MFKEFVIIFVLLAIFFYLSQDPIKNKSDTGKQESKWDFWLKITGSIIVALVFILIGTKYSSSVNWFMSKIPFVNKYFDVDMPEQSGGGEDFVKMDMVDDGMDYDMDDNISIISE